MCRPRLPWPITLPFGVVPVLLITVWAACPNPLPSEQGQAWQKTSLVLAEFTIVWLLHMALESWMELSSRACLNRDFWVLAWTHLGWLCPVENAKFAFSETGSKVIMMTSLQLRSTAVYVWCCFWNKTIGVKWDPGVEFTASLPPGSVFHREPIQGSSCSEKWQKEMSA